MEQISAKLMNVKMSARKMRLVADLVRSQKVSVALEQLRVMPKEAARHIRHLLLSARANATHNFGAAEKDLEIKDIQVGEGPTMKRWVAGSRGRANPILKRSCHVYLNLKTTEPLSKVAQAAGGKTGTPTITKVATKADIKKDVESIDGPKSKSGTVGGKGFDRQDKKGFLGKVFRRKSISG